MLRVLATLQNSEFRNKFKKQIEDLRKWTDEIQTGMYNHLVRLSFFFVAF